MGVGPGSKPVDGMPVLPIEALEKTGMQLPIGIVQNSAQSIGPYIGRRPDILGPDMNAVHIEQVPQFPQLVHEVGTA